MFPCLFVAILFSLYVITHHVFEFVRWIDACGLFIIATVVFVCQLTHIYNQTTQDQRMVTGYVTSLIYHPAYSYQHGKHVDHVPEGWIIEQRSRPPIRQINLRYSIMNGAGIEFCKGECFYAYPQPPYHDYDPMHNNNALEFFENNKLFSIGYNTNVKNDLAKIHPMYVNKNKFDRTFLGETSTGWEAYYNPVKVSPEVIYSNNSDTIPYFEIHDVNHAHRIIAPDVTNHDQANLEKLNAKFHDLNIAIGIVITKDNLYFEKLKRAWHLGKSNDFVIVINSPDGRRIRNIDVLGWNNYALKEEMIEAIQAKQSIKIPVLLSTIEKVLSQEKDFKQADFSSYKFLNINIPAFLYHKIITYQAIFYLYMIYILRYFANNKKYIEFRIRMILFFYVPLIFMMTFFA